MTVHKLKISNKYAQDIIYNGKNFEVRKNDIDFKIGDMLNLTTLDKSITITAVISYILNDKEYCKEDYVILGLKNIHEICYVDDNGNAWTNKYTVSEAVEHSKNLINCYGCIDCEYCENCTDCIGCQECNNCTNCIEGEDCNNCNNVTEQYFEEDMTGYDDDEEDEE